MEFGGDREQGNLGEYVDARVKLFLTLGLLVLLVGARKPVGPEVCFFILFLLSLAVLPAGTLFKRLLPLVFLAFFFGLMQLFLWEGRPLFEVHLAGLVLRATREGLERGFLLGARLLGASLLLFLFTATTPLKDVLAAGRWLRLPEALLELVTSAYRGVHLLAEEIGVVWQAQRLRLGYTGFWRGLRSAGELGGIVLLRALERAELQDQALRSRGCTKLSSSLPFQKSSSPTANLAACSLGALLGTLLVLLGW